VSVAPGLKGRTQNPSAVKRSHKIESSFGRKEERIKEKKPDFENKRKTIAHFPIPLLEGVRGGSI